MNDLNSKLPSIVYAEVSVHSQGGVSLFQSSEQITHENISQFYSHPQQVNLAIQRLQAEGFEVLETGRVTLSIAGSIDLYERVFKTKIVAKDQTVIKGGGLESIGTFFDTPDTGMLGFVDPSSSPLSDLIEGIALSEPVYYTDVGLPSESPPSPSYWHLIPQDIAHKLNAVTAHQQGIKGQGINVVMVDSGWYRHPFFARNGYQGKVILGAGCINPEVDENGHGTGESANLFSVAPEINFTMIKWNFKNSIAAFKKAVALRPDVISCSWGSSKQYAPLSAYDIALTANIADAVYQGVIVVFSAGNGHWGFPSQHPDVIAAGGVYINSEGKLEASNYASGFSSNIYSGRTVPDICGLVGKKPRAAYIVLPVPPGSTLDAAFGIPGIQHPDADETSSEDGWAAFSGTSAAAPQVAGICALMKQVNPQLSPQQAKEILQQTAIDVIAGNCNSATGGHSAKPGFDWATGRGLVNGFEAVKTAQKLARGEIKRQNQNFQVRDAHPVSKHKNIKPVEGFMNFSVDIQSNEQLTQKLNKLDIKWQLDQKLQELLKAARQKDADIPYLEIDQISFTIRSPKTNVVAALKQEIEEVKNSMKNVGKINIPLSALVAAESLLKMGQADDFVIEFLTEVLEKADRPIARSRAIKALGELSSCGCGSKSSNPNEDDELMVRCSDGTSAECNIKENGIWNARCGRTLIPCTPPNR